MDSVRYQFTDKNAFDSSFQDTAGKIYGQGVFITDNGAVGSWGKRLPHEYIKAFHIFFHLLRNLYNAQICHSCCGLAVLYPDIELSDYKIF